MSLEKEKEIINVLEENNFQKSYYDVYSYVKRVHDNHYLFYSQQLKHFAIGRMNWDKKKESSGVLKKWNIIILPKPIYNKEEAINLIKSISL